MKAGRVVIIKNLRICSTGWLVDEPFPSKQAKQRCLFLSCSKPREGQNHGDDFSDATKCHNPDIDSDTTFNSAAAVPVSNPKWILTPDCNRLPVVLEPNPLLAFGTD